jgi:hypothetical protein
MIPVIIDKDLVRNSNKEISNIIILTFSIEIVLLTLKYSRIDLFMWFQG